MFLRVDVNARQVLKEDFKRHVSSLAIFDLILQIVREKNEGIFAQSMTFLCKDA